MQFYVDSHIHSKYSRATSKDLNLENLSLWANKKGITVLGTGDFTHPAWFSEIKEKLIPAEPGLFRLKPEIENLISQQLPTYTPTRFMLTVEISTIYKKYDKTRKIHHIIYSQDLAAAERIIHSLSKIGNLKADGRPILGLDSRNLLEIILEAGQNNYLIPAHIWTPWFAVLGSKSGFDSIEECYEDLSSHIFALETGLSSDPYMNWRVSSLDKYRLVSNSDAHSASKLGRELTLFDTDLNYFAIKNSLLTGNGYIGTVEFFPEEGKYHLDGHRKCNLCLEPSDTLKHNNICPICGEQITVGVLHRVNALADKNMASPPKTSGQVISLIPLIEILSEINQKGVASKKIQYEYENLISTLGSELDILQSIPLEEIKSNLLQEAIGRLRSGQVIKQAGYDGEYGVIKLFENDELEQKYRGNLLFDFPPVGANNHSPPHVRAIHESPLHHHGPSHHDHDQQQAIQIINGPLLIVAGPGSGKTRTLTQRISYMIKEKDIDPKSILLPDLYQNIAIHTFHSLCFSILKKHGAIRESPVQGQIDFDEFIALTIKLFTDHPKILKKYQQQFYYLSVDEYQDIDDSQYELIKLLASKNLCVIGDPNQAIYKFRGGDATYFKNFTQDYPKAKIINLKRNYRSTPTIVNASNQIVAENAVSMLQDAGDKITIHIAKTDKAEAEFIVKTIEDLIGGHNFFAIDSGRTTGQESKFSFADFAVFYRTKKQAKLIAEALERSSMPFNNYSTELLLNNKENQLIVKKLQEDNYDLKQINNLTEYDKNSLAQIKTFAELVNYDRDRFFSEISFAKETDSIDDRADHISLMTMHAAKGLEFKVVFMTGLEDGILPLYFAKKETADLAEEQRLFYVGMTRAKEKLYLTRAEKRLMFGKLKTQQPSPFLNNIEQRLTELSKTKLKLPKKKPESEQLSLWD
jgi:DNA helicase-2/ATP-dependent DNA helicase PcrA